MEMRLGATQSKQPSRRWLEKWKLEGKAEGGPPHTAHAATPCRPGRRAPTAPVGAEPGADGGGGPARGPAGERCRGLVGRGTDVGWPRRERCCSRPPRGPPRREGGRPAPLYRGAAAAEGAGEPAPRAREEKRRGAGEGVARRVREVGGGSGAAIEEGRRSPAVHPAAGEGAWRAAAGLGTESGGDGGSGRRSRGVERERENGSGRGGAKRDKKI
ncbi:hypothetical protein PVAP13_2NG330806 [Panicum virgatum]|uniref:Uncharacterized protein n=1 Tax=Panicum virgatum TaxID=38727 RepID=A0A8T0VK45_PANVG|nr:hypothetical protein PVAP13_2NG330806 [Panicum virgatum]